VTVVVRDLGVGVTLVVKKSTVAAFNDLHKLTSPEFVASMPDRERTLRRLFESAGKLVRTASNVIRIAARIDGNSG
jgi:hypothetical protein